MVGDRFEYLLEMLSTLKGNWGEMETKTFDFPSQINPPHPGYISDHSTVYLTLPLKAVFGCIILLHIGLIWLNMATTLWTECPPPPPEGGGVGFCVLGQFAQLSTDSQYSTIIFTVLVL
jgi:hypothetical protein